MARYAAAGVISEDNAAVLVVSPQRSVLYFSLFILRSRSLILAVYHYLTLNFDKNGKIKGASPENAFDFCYFSYFQRLIL